MDKVAEAEVLPAETRKSEVAAINITPKTPMEMLNQAVANGAGAEVMEKLLDLHERWEANQARKAFDAAMSDLRSNMPEIIKKREVDFTSQKGRTNYKYEDLSVVTEALSPVMAEHGLSFRWRTDQTESGQVKVTCIISHRDGHSEETSLSAGHDATGNKNPIQAIGSTVTYLQRYTLKAAIGTAAAPDMDGALPPDNTPISDEQFHTIRDLIDETKSDIPKFCRYLGVDSIKDIPARQYDKAIKLLESKKANS